MRKVALKGDLYMKHSIHDQFSCHINTKWAYQPARVCSLISTLCSNSRKLVTSSKVYRFSLFFVVVDFSRFFFFVFLIFLYAKRFRLSLINKCLLLLCVCF